ncbi:MAG: sugar transferase [Pseudomonadota bacterium]
MPANLLEDETMYLFLKRAFDIGVAGFACLLLLPLLIPVAIALRMTSEGEVFYLQERVGHKNRRFHIYKFATMLKNAPNMAGGIITTRNDPRLTTLGGILRKTKINELPQLLNIVFGHMSLVGPRPVMPQSFDAYPDEVQRVIYDAKPGLTGIGSIIFRDEEEIITAVRDAGGDVWSFYKDTIYPYKGQVELWYQDKRSFLLDLKLIFLTAWAILFPESRLHEKWFPDLPKRTF